MNSVRMVARNVRSGVRSMSTNSATKKGPYSNDQWFNLKHGYGKHKTSMNPTLATAFAVLGVSGVGAVLTCNSNLTR